MPKFYHSWWKYDKVLTKIIFLLRHGVEAPPSVCRLSADCRRLGGKMFGRHNIFKMAFLGDMDRTFRLQSNYRRPMPCRPNLCRLNVLSPKCLYVLSVQKSTENVNVSATRTDQDAAKKTLFEVRLKRTHVGAPLEQFPGCVLERLARYSELLQHQMQSV